MNRAGMAVGVVLLLVSCQKTEQKQQPPPADVASGPAWTGPKACDLLTVEQITKATGAKYNAGVVTTDYAYDSQCRYDAQDTSKAAVMITLHGKSKIDPYRTVPGTFRVESLGDEAWWNDPNAQIAVASDSSVFSIAFLKPPAKQQWGVELARNALERLKTK